MANDFRIPDKAEVGVDIRQSVLFETDIRMITDAAAGPHGVVAGCVVTPVSGLQINVSAGAARVNGKRVTVAGGNLTAASNVSGNPRIDLVYVDNNGGIAIEQGTTAVSPLAPGPTASRVYIAQLWIPNGLATITTNHIYSRRIVITDPGYEVVEWYGAIGDGVTDDTAAWETAIAVFPQSGVSPMQYGGELRAQSLRYKINGRTLAPPTAPSVGTSTTGGTGLVAATTYYYKVTAVNAAGETTGSAEVNVTTGAGTTNSNTVSWTPSPAVGDNAPIGYNVYRATVSGNETWLAFTTGTSYVDTGAVTPIGILDANKPVISTAISSNSNGALPNGAQPYYSVTAMNARGETIQSTEVRANNPISGATGSVAVTWAAVTGASYYFVYRRDNNTTAVAARLRRATGTSYTDTGPPYYPVGGKAPVRNTTGIVPATNTSCLGINLKQRIVELDGLAASTGAGTDAGTYLIPGTANMTMICDGIGTAITQPGFSIRDIGVSDLNAVGGVTAFMLNGTNRTSWTRVYAHNCAVGLKLRATSPSGSATDNAWHDLIDCTFYYNDVNVDCGDTNGITIVGGEFDVVDGGIGIMLNVPTGYPCLANQSASQSVKLIGVFIDGKGDAGPTWSGTSIFSLGSAGLEVHACKMEAATIGVWLDDPLNSYRGRSTVLVGNSHYGPGSNNGTAIILENGVSDIHVFGAKIFNLYQDVQDNTIGGSPATSELTWVGGTASPPTVQKMARTVLKEVRIGPNGVTVKSIRSGTQAATIGTVNAGTVFAGTLLGNGTFSSGDRAYVNVPATGLAVGLAYAGCRITAGGALEVEIANITGAGITDSTSRTWEWTVMTLT